MVGGDADDATMSREEKANLARLAAIERWGLEDGLPPDVETHAFDDVPLVPLKMPPRVIRARKVPRHTMPEGFTPLNPVAFAKNVALATKSNDALAALEAKKAAAAEWRRDPAMTNPPPAHETEHSRAGR